MKKKNDIVRKIVKTLQTKTNDPMSSLLNEIKILNEKDVAKDDIPFVKNYE